MQGQVGRPYRWVTGWGLWQAPSQVRSYVLVVYAFAAAVAVATAFLLPVTRTDLTRFGVLALCAVVYIEVTRRIERQREYWRGSASPYLDTKSVWSFAAVLVLPPVLASAMVILTYVVAWWRIWPHERPVPLYRWVFSGATVLCGTQAAVAVLALGMHHYPGVPQTALPAGLVDLTVIALAGVMRWLVNAGLVFAAILISNTKATVADLLRNFSEHLSEAGTMGLGLVAATLVVGHPVVLAGVVVALVAMHRSLLLHQFQHKARTDTKTGLATAGWWHELAEQALARAQDRNGTLGMLMLDLDHFKNINDKRGGHLVGDQVLAAVGDALRAETREQDICGRFGGDELAILIPDVGTPPNLLAVAERIRRRVHSLVVEVPGGDADRESFEVAGLTVSIGAALFPVPGVEDLDDLLRLADAALYEAKRGGRDRTCLSAAPDLIPTQSAGT
ncbi:GGDEF domain-containing protein [Amycolatopsis sp. cmx-4-61]|uniref:GGDEF domain-containing protein n=1 Tax=Amycolatopsis sp. cmx-4-61 TaxID=2790937 RepID=UPI00397D59DB